MNSLAIVWLLVSPMQWVVVCWWPPCKSLMQWHHIQGAAVGVHYQTWPWHLVPLNTLDSKVDIVMAVWSNDIPPYDYSQRQELWLKIVADISTGQPMYRGLYKSRNISQFLTLSPSSSHHLSLFPTFYSCCNSNEYERQNQTIIGEHFHNWIYGSLTRWGQTSWTFTWLGWVKTKWVTNKRCIYHTERRIAWIICRHVQNSQKIEEKLKTLIWVCKSTCNKKIVTNSFLNSCFPPLLEDIFGPSELFCLPFPRVTDPPCNRHAKYVDLCRSVARATDMPGNIRYLFRCYRI